MCSWYKKMYSAGIDYDAASSTEKEKNIFFSF